MVAVVAGALLLLAGTSLLLAGQFGDQALAAAGVGLARARRGRAKSRFRPRPAPGALRRKEWVLLYRDPWLMSQTLMQLLYLLPPALLLWQNFGDNGDAELVLVPILVVAAGQLAGGLAWLAISGEDAPDLIATAPITPRTEIRAKVEAVLIGISIIALPLVAAMWMTSPWAGLVTAVFSLLAALGATAVQLIFRGQAKRSQFRRRQTSSRFATFAEAFSSMAWAGAAGLAASGSWLAGGAVAVAIGVLGIAWLIRPRAQVAAKPVRARRQMA